MALIAPPRNAISTFALLGFLIPSQFLGIRNSMELAIDSAEQEMPNAIMGMIKGRMPPGAHVSMGFEFECANKEFKLNPLLPEYWPVCPTLEFPLDGVSKAKPEEMLPEIYGNSIPESLDMRDYEMPQAVHNIVWTKDAFITDMSPECVEYDRGYDLVSKVPMRGLVSHGEVYNNGNCSCLYTLEFKTLPMHTEADIRESMVGAALTLKEASKKDQGFQNWNVEKLFTMKSSRDKCIGATHVTKAYVINKKSLIDMLNQQNFGFCAKGWSKEFAGDKVFRTSFAEAYMLWRAIRYCGDNTACRANLTLPDMCANTWMDPFAAQADIDASLFSGEAEKAELFEKIFHAMSDNERTLEEWATEGGACTPGMAVFMACENMLSQQEELNLDEPVLDPDLGFGYPAPHFYYGPGGGRKDDTTTKVGAMISADGKTLFGLAEHRKDNWNTKDFKTCIYKSLARTRNFEDGLKLFNKSSFCKNALENSLVVDYATNE